MKQWKECEQDVFEPENDYTFTRISCELLIGPKRRENSYKTIEARCICTAKEFFKLLGTAEPFYTSVRLPVPWTSVTSSETSATAVSALSMGAEFDDTHDTVERNPSDALYCLKYQQLFPLLVFATQYYTVHPLTIIDTHYKLWM